MADEKRRSRITPIPVPQLGDYRTTLAPMYSSMAREYYQKATDTQPDNNNVTTRGENIRRIMVDANGEMHFQDAAFIDAKCQIEQTATTEKYAFIAVVFAHMALEAYINDYGLRKLSGAFMTNDVARLGLAAKWLLFPQLITGKRFPVEGRAYELLRKLVKARNELTHFKGKKVLASDEVGEKIGLRYWVRTAAEAIEAMDAVAKVLEELDPSEKNMISHVRGLPPMRGFIFHAPELGKGDWYKWEEL